MHCSEQFHIETAWSGYSLMLPVRNRPVTPGNLANGAPPPYTSRPRPDRVSGRLARVSGFGLSREMTMVQRLVIRKEE